MKTHALTERTLSRRSVLAGIPLAAEAVAGCSTTSNDTSASSSDSATTTSIGLGHHDVDRRWGSD